MAEKTAMREEAMDAEQSMYSEEVRGEKRASSVEDSGCVRIPPNNRKSGGSPGAGGAWASDLTQELEAVLAENPLTPIGGSGSAAGVWMGPDSSKYEEVRRLFWCGRRCAGFGPDAGVGGCPRSDPLTPVGLPRKSKCGGHVHLRRGHGGFRGRWTKVIQGE